VVADLVLRYLWLHGSGTLALLNQTLKLSFPVLEILFHQFRNQQLLEVKGMTGNDYSFSLTASGRTQAAGRNEVCQYVGPAPVSIQQYQKVVKAQAARVRLSRESLRHAFDDLVLPDGLLDQLGPALIGHQSLFLYGGTGNGKTSIAERILRIYHDTIAISSLYSTPWSTKHCPLTTKCWIRAGRSASGPASRWAASCRRRCWNSGWMNPPRSLSLPAR
jgi:hypothetical protein